MPEAAVEPFVPYEPFLERLAAVCRRQPEAIALRPAEGPELSYGELWKQIESLGAGLKALGTQPGDRVALSYGRSPEFVLALLACWHAGAVWTPIAGLPSDRRQTLLNEAEPVCILGPGHLELEALAQAAHTAPVHSKTLAPPAWVPGQARDNTKFSSSNVSVDEYSFPQQDNHSSKNSAHASENTPPPSKNSAHSSEKTTHYSENSTQDSEKSTQASNRSNYYSDKSAHTSEISAYSRKNISHASENRTPSSKNGVIPAVFEPGPRTGGETQLPASWVPGLSRDDSRFRRTAYVPAPDEAAYLIFTSGSTGKPKGVLVPHAGIVPMLSAQIELFALDSHSRSLWLLSPLFDASLSDIGTALLSGATLVIDPEPLRDLDYFYALLQQHAISYIDLPPVLLSVLDQKRLPASLATITIGGEVADPAQVKRWSGQLRLINVYGPTEATVCTSAMRCLPDHEQTGLLGQPLPGVNYTFDGEVPAPGQRGELWIQSPGLALGYRGQPRLTAQRFVMHQGRRWYRSGDRVEYTTSGEYRFLGRIDRQFKQQGRLLCPEEVEAALMALPGIQRAVVLQHSSGALTACLQGKTRLPDIELAAALAERLPNWMIPVRWLWPEPWPLTPSGKPDAAALAHWQLPQPDISRNPEALSPTQQPVAAIWSSLLKQPVVSPDADFFALGGSSVQVLACIARAAEAGLRLNPESFYRERRLDRILAAEQSQAMSLGTLRKRLPESLPDSPSTMAPSAHGSILLTGATGFLGSRLLAELLQQGSRSITCLVRAADPELGRRRVHLALRPWLKHPLRPDFEAGLEIVCGDLGLPDLGLGAKDAETLFQGVDTVLHCAALVDLVRDFESLYSANVAASARLAALSQTHGAAFHLVSSLSVFVALTPKAALADEALCLSRLDDQTLIHGGYAQSKFAADIWLQNQSLPHWIYRPGLVTGDSRTGHGPERDWLRSLIRGLLALGAIPAPNPLSDALEVDITPVDYVAAGIVALLDAAPGAYHLANPEPLSLSALLQALQAWSQHQGPALEVLPAAAFRQRAQAQLRRAPGLADGAALLALCAVLDPEAASSNWHSLNLFQASGIRLASVSTAARLAAAGLVCPSPDQALLEAYFRVFAKASESEALYV